MRWIIPGVLVACAAAALAAWRLESAHRRQIPTYTIVKPVLGDLETAVTATGTLYPRHSVDIKFDGQEIVERLNVKEGDHVRAGEVLALMDTRVLDHARLQNVQAMAKDNASLVQAQDAYTREKALFAEGIVARSDYESTQATYQSLVHQRMADQEGVRETAQQMDRAVLRSPINGTVVEIYVQAGEMLGSATAVAALGPNLSVSKPTNVLMTVVEDGPLEVYAGVNAADLGSLEAGQDADISIDAFQPAIFHGKVQRISLEPVVINNVTTYQAIVTFTQSDPRFRIGLPADVMLFKQLARDREIIPARSVTGTGTSSTVCVLRSLSAASVSQPRPLHPSLLPVSIAARTEDAIALRDPLPSEDWVLEEPSACRQNAQQARLQIVSFDPNPSFAANRQPRAKQAQEMSSLPAPEPKGWLQNLLGL